MIEVSFTGNKDGGKHPLNVVVECNKGVIGSVRNIWFSPNAIMNSEPELLQFVGLKWEAIII